MNRPEQVWLLLRAPSAPCIAHILLEREHANRNPVLAACEKDALILDASARRGAGTPWHFFVGAEDSVGTTITHAEITGSGALLHYQWQRNGIELPGADQDFLALRSRSPADASSLYSTRISNGRTQAVFLPAVRLLVTAETEPPWRWADLAAKYRGRPDLLAALFVAFRGRCTSE